MCFQCVSKGSVFFEAKEALGFHRWDFQTKCDHHRCIAPNFPDSGQVTVSFMSKKNLGKRDAHMKTENSKTLKFNGHVLPRRFPQHNVTIRFAGETPIRSAA